jgi:hypothetical protein
MVRAYVRKTDQRRHDERAFSVRVVHREPVDMPRLAQVLVRLTLQETGYTRAARRQAQTPETLTRSTTLSDTPMLAVEPQRA